MMKKTLLLCALALGAIAPAANAFNNQEIAAKGKVWRAMNEEDVWITVRGINYQYTSDIPYLFEGDINVSLNSDGYLVLSSSIDESYFGLSTPVEMIVNVSGTTATVMNNCYKQPIGTGATTRINNVTYNVAVLQSFHMLTSYKVGNTTHYIGIVQRTKAQPTSNDTNATTNKLTGTVSYDAASDTYTIDFGKLDIVDMYMTSANVALYRDINNNGVVSNTNTNNNSNYYGNSTDFSYFVKSKQRKHSGMRYTAYTPNANVTDTEYEYNSRGQKVNANARSYTANVQIKGDKIYIENFSNMGRASVGYYDSEWITHTKWERFTGDFDGNSLNVYMDPMDVAMANATPYSNGDFTIDFRLISSANEYDLKNALFSSIKGTVENVNGAKHTGTNKWLNQLDNKTYLSKPQISFENYIFVDQDVDDNCSLVAAVDNTKISLQGDFEYTHDCAIQKHEYGYGTINGKSGNYIYVNLDVTDFKNAKFVKDYEIYIVPGNANQPNYNAPEFNNEEQGHTQGTMINKDEYITEFGGGIPTTQSINTLATDNDEPEYVTAINYNLLVPESDLKAKDETGSGNYSVYAKAIYDPACGLKPSFHALTSLGQRTTGVESIIDNGVADEDAPVVYYNMNGVQVSGDALTPGLYIRKQGNNATKVVIK